MIIKKIKFIILVLIILLILGFIGCNKDYSASGNLRIKPIDYHTIDAYYSFSDTLDVYLIIIGGTTPMIFVGSGSDSGVYRYSNLSPNTSYTFYLQCTLNGILATATGKTPSH